jgi:hypothetical protein
VPHTGRWRRRSRQADRAGRSVPTVRQAGAGRTQRDAEADRGAGGEWTPGRSPC